NRDMGRTTIVDRASEKAIEAKDRFIEFAKEHPIATVAGGVAVGILVSGLFKRSPTRRLGGAAAKRAGAIAALGAEFALAYAQQAMTVANEAARDGAHRLGELGETVGSTARSTGRATAERAGELTDSARLVSRDVGKRLGKALRSRIN
ncbi:MAG TPA: hypothetical protein VFS49_03790, partial [Croceibacterium sp.]|nr:hypothetical protein [Croceibacterium sp.]